MRILVACERSGVVRDALLRLGHDAISCDIEPTRTPGPHYEGDVRDILYFKWDAMIAHPVCRYMTNAGVRWLHTEPGRWEKMEAGVEFFNLLDRATHIPLRAVENPVMHGYALELVGRKATQFVHPWWFGDPLQKATGLWLTGLPKLVATHKKSDYAEGEIKQEVWLCPPGPDREEIRSRTPPRIGAAFAEQWFGKVT